MTIATIVLDCARLNDSDAGTIDGIARCQLAAGRKGVGLRLEHASSSLLELIDFCGLARVLRVESGRQAEQGKQPGRVEEEREVGDPAL